MRIIKYKARKKKSTLLFCLTFFIITFLANAQTKNIKGTIKAANGSPLIGVNVVQKGTSNGVTTDFDGKYEITLKDGSDILVISFLGYSTIEQSVKGKPNADFVMIEDVYALDELVVVGYSKQKKSNLTASVATLKAEELSRVPVSNVTNALAGQLPGLIAQQSSGIPGGDASSLNIRGFGNALIVVDGVITSFDNIDASQIESVNVLKDGAASIYGARAGNGVVLITTKRGSISKPTFNFETSYTLQKPTYLQDMLSSGDYTTLLSEAHIQSGQPIKTVPYTEEQIRKYYEASEPGYYNTNWSDVILRDYAPLQKYGLSSSGGTEKIKYYAFLGILNQGSFWKENGGDYKRYNFQLNLDAEISENFSVSITSQNIIEDINSTNRSQVGAGYLFSDLYNNKPMYPSSLPDATKIPYSGSETGGALVQSNRNLGGYTDNDIQKLNQSISLNYSIPQVNGLAIKTFFNYIQITSQQKSFSRPVDLWSYNVDNEKYTLAAQFNNDSPLSQEKAISQEITGQFSINYTRMFEDIHDVNAMLLYEISDYKSDYITARRTDFTYPNLDVLNQGSPDSMSNSGYAAESGRTSWVGRVNYVFSKKYIADFILRLDRSAKFPKASRLGMFPSVSAGWRLSQEGFMNNFDKLDELKLRISYGKSGNDAIGNFQYLAGYSPTLMPALWGDKPVLGITSIGLANTSLTWEELSITNLGLNYSFFNGGLYGEFDVFSRKREGIPAFRTGTLPSTFGEELPLENINSQTSKGFELQVGTKGTSGKFNWNLVGNVAYQRAKWDHFEEVEYTDPDAIRILKKSGRYVDQTFGYKTVGLFTSQEQIDNLAFTYPGGPTLKPGDIHYVDTNGDGVLDWKDQVEIGKSLLPNWTGGLNFSMNYSDFDFSFLFQGAFGFYKSINLGSFTKTFFDNRWTEENNNPNALISRLGGSGPVYLSDRNYQESSYVRLKNFSIGYSINSSLIDKINIDKIRFYIAGTNLITFSNLNKFDIDPESPFSVQDGQPTTSYYPQQKTIILGLNVTF